MVEFPSPPSDEPVSESSSLKRWWPAAVVLALHLLVSLLIAFVIEFREEVYGVLFGQIALLAVWTAWAPVSFFLRLAGGLLLTGFVVLSLALLIVRSSSGPAEAYLLFQIIILLYGQWIVAQSPLWLVRIAWGQRLAFPNASSRAAGGREWQFGLGQLLGLTACVALLLGLARWFLSPVPLDEIDGEWVTTLMVIGLLVSFSTLAPLPVMWAAFSRRVALWLFLAALYLIGVTVAEVFAVQAVLGPVPGEDALIFGYVNGTMFVVVTATLLAFRFCGFRLHRTETTIRVERHE